MRFIILVLTWLLANIANAETIDIRVVVLSSPKFPAGYVDALTAAQAINGALALHDSHGVKVFRVKDIRLKRDPAPDLDHYLEIVHHLVAIRNSSLHRTMRRNVDFVYYVVSPLANPGGPSLMGGVAGGICTSPRSSMALSQGNMRTANDYGENRLLFSTVIMAHELGHLIGMSHTNSLTLMNGGALAYLPNQLQLAWDPVSVEQMKRCRR